jgi:hypothetical protein
MTAEGCRQWRERLGAFALGGLDESERAAVQAHVDGCAECRAEAEALAPVARLLLRADPEHLEQVPRPPARVGRKVLARIRAERRLARRRRTRLGLAFAGAAASLALMVVVAVSLLGGEPQAAPVQHVDFNTGGSSLELSAAIEPRSWGTEVHMYVHGARKGTLCRVWLRRDDGSRVAAGSFRYRYEDPDDAAVLTTAVPADRVSAVALDVGDRRYVAPVPDERGAES